MKIRISLDGYDRQKFGVKTVLVAGSQHCLFFAGDIVEEFKAPYDRKRIDICYVRTDLKPGYRDYEKVKNDLTQYSAGLFYGGVTDPMNCDFRLIHRSAKNWVKFFLTLILKRYIS